MLFVYFSQLLQKVAITHTHQHYLNNNTQFDFHLPAE